MVTPSMVFPRLQNTVPSLTIFSGGPPSGRSCLGDGAPRRPGAALQDSGKRQGPAIHVEPCAHDLGQTIEQRHGQRTPFHHQL